MPKRLGGGHSPTLRKGKGTDFAPNTLETLACVQFCAERREESDRRRRTTRRRLSSFAVHGAAICARPRLGGAKPIEQLNDNLAAAELTLSPEEIATLDAVSALRPEYPGWMLAREAEGRLPGPKE